MKPHNFITSCIPTAPTASMGLMGPHGACLPCHHNPVNHKQQSQGCWELYSSSSSLGQELFSP